jgi:ABC-type glycerol-3-phosphate transport system substrate-binding protein
VLIALAAVSACREPARPTAIRFLHTFSREETELFNATMAERGIAVESSLVPFARGRQVIAELLRARSDCPDLLRIDATWLPELVADDLVLSPPPALAGRDWTPEAAALARLRDAWWAVPQAVDGLLVVRDVAAPAPASAALADLVAAARAAKNDKRPYPLGIRVDGYWFVPWLRDAGGEMAPGGIGGDVAARAMAALAALFGDVVRPPPTSGLEQEDEGRRWANGELAYWITGPWQFFQLGDRDRIAVGPLAHAPRGGQLLVVPRCARHADDGWRLADELTSLAVEARFAERFATAPTRIAALATAPALSRAAYEALRTAAMLPRDPVTPLLFDDLNAALAAVVVRDASPQEAAAGVQRAWQRLTRRTVP